MFLFHNPSGIELCFFLVCSFHFQKAVSSNWLWHNRSRVIRFCTAPSGAKSTLLIFSFIGNTAVKIFLAPFSNDTCELWLLWYGGWKSIFSVYVYTNYNNSSGSVGFTFPQLLKKLFLFLFFGSTVNTHHPDITIVSLPPSSGEKSLQKSKRTWWIEPIKLNFIDEKSRHLILCCKFKPNQ